MPVTRPRLHAWVRQRIKKNENLCTPRTLEKEQNFDTNAWELDWITLTYYACASCNQNEPSKFQEEDNAQFTIDGAKQLHHLKNLD